MVEAFKSALNVSATDIIVYMNISANTVIYVYCNIHCLDISKAMHLIVM